MSALRRLNQNETNSPHQFWRIKPAVLAPNNEGRVFKAVGAPTRRGLIGQDGVASSDSGSIAWQAWQRHSESASHPIFTPSPGTLRTSARSPFRPLTRRRSRNAPDITATPEAIEEFDAILALALRVTAESVRAVTRPAILARWGVGYDLIDTDALSAPPSPSVSRPRVCGDRSRRRN